MSDILDANGFVAKASLRLRDCLKNAGAFMPDVVLIEVDNHRKKSCAAAIRLRKIAGLETVYLVALTKSRDIEILNRMAKAGFDELLPRVAGVDRIMMSCR